VQRCERYAAECHVRRAFVTLIKGFADIKNDGTR